MKTKIISTQQEKLDELYNNLHSIHVKLSLDTVPNKLLTKEEIIRRLSKLTLKTMNKTSFKSNKITLNDIAIALETDPKTLNTFLKLHKLKHKELFAKIKSYRPISAKPPIIAASPKPSKFAPDFAQKRVDMLKKGILELIASNIIISPEAISKKLGIKPTTIKIWLHNNGLNISTVVLDTTGKTINEINRSIKITLLIAKIIDEADKLADSKERISKSIIAQNLNIPWNKLHNAIKHSKYCLYDLGIEDDVAFRIHQIKAIVKNLISKNIIPTFANIAAELGLDISSLSIYLTRHHLKLTDIVTEDTATFKYNQRIAAIRKIIRNNYEPNKPVDLKTIANELGLPKTNLQLWLESNELSLASLIEKELGTNIGYTEEKKCFTAINQKNIFLDMTSLIEIIDRFIKDNIQITVTSLAKELDISRTSFLKALKNSSISFYDLGIEDTLSFRLTTIAELSKKMKEAKITPTLELLAKKMKVAPLALYNFLYKHNYNLHDLINQQ